MANDPIVLFDNGHHKCLMFDSLVTGEGVQSNQFLIVDGKHEALIDPGGDLTYTPLSVADFDRHIPDMIGFHRRYIASRKVCALWADMVRGMDVAMIVPQHGKRFESPLMVDRFLSWVSEMDCGIDLMTRDNYRRPVDYVS